MLSKEELDKIQKVMEEVESDPEVARKAEEDQRRYGTLSAEDLMIVLAYR